MPNFVRKNINTQETQKNGSEILHLKGIFSPILLKFWAKKCQKMAQKAEFCLVQNVKIKIFLVIGTELAQKMYKIGTF